MEVCKMSVLDGFTAFNFDEGVPYVSVTRNGVTFNKAVVMKLNYPENVLLLISDAEKRKKQFKNYFSSLEWKGFA